MQLNGSIKLADGTWAETSIMGYKPLMPGARYLLFLKAYPVVNHGVPPAVAALIERAGPGGLWVPTYPGSSAFELRDDGTVDPANSRRSPDMLTSAYRGLPATKLLADVRAAVQGK